MVLNPVRRFSKNPNVRDYLRIFPIFRPYLLRAGEAAGCTFLMTILALPLPLLSIYVVDQVVATGSVNALHMICAGLCLATTAGLVLAFLQRYLLLVFTRRVFFDLEVLLFQKIQKLPVRFFRKHEAGYLSTRISDDVRQLGSLMAGTYIEGMSSLALVNAGVCVMVIVNTKLALLVLALLPLYAFANFRMGRLIQSRSEVFQERKGLSNAARIESIGGAHITRAFGRERWETIRIIRKIKRELNAGLSRDTAVAAAQTVHMGLYSFGSLILIWFGAYEITQNRLTVGQFIAFSTMISYLYGPIGQLSNLYIGFRQGFGVLRRVISLMDLDTESTERRPAAQISAGVIEFEDIWFQYEPGTLVLRSLNLRLEPGKTTAIVGASGSGKTTIVNLIMRFYEPTRGRVLLDGVDIREFDLEGFRQQIGLVDQEALMFGGTVRENIAYGSRKANENDVWSSADAMNCTEFLSQFPLGLETRIGSGGVQLSGGQRKRVALARAIIRNPRILVLDEATSSLDPGSEKAIQDALKNATSGRTTLVIAHHLSTIMMADHVAVLDQGNVVEEGPFEVLFARRDGYFSGHYQRENLEMLA